MLDTLRLSFANFASRRAASSRRAERWHRVACAVAPRFVPSHQALVELLRARDARWEAHAVAQEAAERFPESADAWMLLGDAWQLVFRQQEALVAYEQALVFDERPDAALAAGAIYRRSGQFADAAARFARAYAAGGGAEALRQNAEALYQAGDDAAADQALSLWAMQVPDGPARLAQLRADLRAARRTS
ncbi:MAG: hypothetical protein ACREMF_11735 [Gemmatimonadales bacterium]